VAQALSDAVNASLEQFADRGLINYLASHGQTIYHIPEENSQRGWLTKSTLQVGDANVLLQRTGVPVVVNDFRPADMACGGQGAPLVCVDDWSSHCS
jgi:anhydro-N-acetylmuramic acid kinase